LVFGPPGILTYSYLQLSYYLITFFK